MRKNAKMDFDLLCFTRSTPQERCEPSFESRNRTFRLHPLTVFGVRKMPVHLSPVLALGPTPPPSPVDLDDCAADAQNLASEHMIVFCVVAGIRQKSVDADSSASLLQDRTHQGSVVARTIAYDGMDQQVCGVVASQRQFGPSRKEIAFLPCFVSIMRRAVSCFQSGRVDAGFLFRADKSLLLGVVEDCVQQPVEQTFFKRRCCVL